MIERYTLPEMGRVWSDQHKYELWCRVETLVLEAHAAAGRVPADVVEPVRNAPPPTPERVAEIEETTQHDVIAFLTAWADNTEPRSAAAYVHHGMTSSDLLDTALAVQLTDATDVLLAKADRLVAALRDHGLAHRDTIKVGRTHGVHAEPDVWGHRVADLAFAMARSRDRLRDARARVGVVAISGAVGTYSLIDPSVEVVRRRGAWTCGRPTPRRRWCSATRSASGCRRWRSSRPSARRSRSRCGTASAPRCGSCRRRSGRARRARARCRTRRTRSAPSASPGWRGSCARRSCRSWRASRSGTSATSRTPRPSGSSCPTPRSPPTTCCDLTAGLVENLVVDADRMRANLESTGGLIYTSSVLLELVEGGLSREDAYALVQAAAMETWNGGTPFRETLRTRAAADGVTLDEARLDEICRPEQYVANLGPLFDRLAALT